MSTISNPQTSFAIRTILKSPIQSIQDALGELAAGDLPQVRGKVDDANELLAAIIAHADEIGEDVPSELRLAHSLLLLDFSNVSELGTPAQRKAASSALTRSLTTMAALHARAQH